MVEQIRKTKKGVLEVLMAGAVILIICLASACNISISDTDAPLDENPSISDADAPLDEIFVAENTEMPTPLNVSLDITELYHTHVGDPSNLYYIDENNVLWGSGRNEYGQLGQGTQDYEFHSEAVKIAENVIDVDYSQEGFAIFLTEDLKLYGLGNIGCGGIQAVNDERYYLSEPYLLMENVKYARCGRDDIACLTEDGAVWMLEDMYYGYNSFYQDAALTATPQKVLENAVLVTGGWFHHAALLQDGTVWTWGYNSSGNCGVADLDVVSEPTMVAEDVVMVWTDLAVDNYPQPDAEEIARAWTGSLTYDMEYDNIAGFDGIYPRFLNNTVIRKADGSYWVCGENVGTEEKVVHGAEGDYSAVWTYEFYLCE